MPRPIIRRTIKDLSQKQLKELLVYNSDTGVWRWRVSRGSVKKGMVAGSIHGLTGYRGIGVNGKTFQSSRLAFLYIMGFLPKHEVDHKNRKRSDDRWKNLRLATRQDNNINQGLKSNNKSGVAGVYWEKCVQKWCARIRVDRICVYLGVFNDFDEAVLARYKAEESYGFTKLNPESSSYLYLNQNWTEYG